MKNLFAQAQKYKSRIAIISSGQSYSYTDLISKSTELAHFLLRGRTDLNGARIAFLMPPSFEYTALMWAIWRAGGIAVPLCEKHPLASLTYVIEDTQAECLVYSKEFKNKLEPLSEKVTYSFDFEEAQSQNITLDLAIKNERSALILYTSGTTGNPKGVVTTHQNIEAQITSLTHAWEWSKEDHILNVLPMHHVHGIINVLSCALSSGACCEFLPRFDSKKVFDSFSRESINVFMAVPTIYYKLIAFWKELSLTEQEEISLVLKRFRLMVSGSAALPVSVLEAWKKISGHVLLERYGMTEMGMAISNSYRAERIPGHIGLPLEGVTVRLADEQNQPVKEGNQGEIQVKGPNVFKEYWNKPKATQATFTKEGWFKTGDIAVFENNCYRILGRNSVDIIKSGGYKISALEIEEALRKHPDIKECGVVGVPDEEWGELICASLIVTKETLDFKAVSTWLKSLLPSYKIPRKYILLEDLPRNVMGKVTKNELKKLFI